MRSMTGLRLHKCTQNMINTLIYNNCDQNILANLGSCKDGKDKILHIPSTYVRMQRYISINCSEGKCRISLIWRTYNI